MTLCLLRITGEHDVCFRGLDGEECTGFIRQVRRKAFEAGKSRDKEWMADYAVSCFADDALKWSIKVHRDVLEDWDVLQRALMEEYCKDRVSSIERSGVAGTTPAAAPAAAPRVALPIITSTMTGFVRVVAETPEAGSYISKTVDPRFGVLRTCTEAADAARVKLIPLMSNYGIQLVDFPEPYCWLGVSLTDTLEKGGQIGPETFGNLCPTSAPASHAMGTSTKDLPGPARSNIWLFQSLDSCIISVWSNFDYIYLLQPMVNLGNKRILAVSNCPKFLKGNSDMRYAKARLIFEPA
ncbi:hypothetical protein FS837_000528 [Tulasnella sp. UAMH 9824]|nr:hypothetical protein FS837_000528 [Tulasnella sp. UAMH 9824]